MQAERGEGSAATQYTDDLDSLPWIFLSHSGRQKPFVTKLYHALLHAKHRPFFDMDSAVSLPSGLDYPSRIFQACQACKMGVIVLSEDYVQTLWPMIELQHLVRPGGSSDRFIYPHFYNLQPSDLSDPNNLARWEECWAKQAAERKWEGKLLKVQEYMASCGCEIQINLDISSWSKILQGLQYQSGEVRQKVNYINHERIFQDRSEWEYIDAVVSNICVALPAPHSLDAGIQGGQRLHQEMAKAFEQDESLGADEVRRVGVYGIGGSGKSTLCKIMATFYSNEFGGRCYHLEFPMKDNEVEKLLQNIKAILPALILHSASIDNVCTIDQALNLLDEGLQAKKVFLAIDNVWDNVGHHSFDYAQRTMLMKCMPGSKVLVTTRSKELLTRLLFQRSSSSHMHEGNTMNQYSMARACPGNVVQVPSLTEEEAVQALKFYSCISYLIPEDYLWRSLARSCVFAGQCHPLYLKLKGVGLRTKGRLSFNNQKWKELFSSLEIRGNARSCDDTISCEAEVLCAVEKSFIMLPSHLQDVFIDLATTWEVDNVWYLEWSRLELVRYQYDNYCTKDAMSYAVHELEYHGLLEFELVEFPGLDMGGRYKEKLIIHDLHRVLANSKASTSGGNANALIKHALLGDLSLVSPSAIASKKLVLGHDLNASTLASFLGSSKLASTIWTTLLKRIYTNPGQAQTRVLFVHGSMQKIDWISGPVRMLNLKGGRIMEALRALALDDIKGVREIKGWEGVPNLVRLDLLHLEDLKRIGSLGHLKLLETFTLRSCPNVQLQALVGDPCKTRCLVTVDDHLPKLQVLYVRKNDHVEELGSRFTDAFPALRTLQLRQCDNLKSISDLSKASSTLQTLELCYAESLESIVEGGISSLTALQYLDLTGCRSLERIPDLSNLMGLQGFHVNVCSSLSEPVRLNLTITAPTHLKFLSLNQVKCNITHDHRSCNILSLLGNVVFRDFNDQLFDATFNKLQFLQIGSGTSETCRCLEVSGLPSLQTLNLSSFESVQKLSISLTSLKAIDLFAFPILEEIRFLAGAPQYTSLSHARISRCLMLKRIANVPISLRLLSLDDYEGLKDLCDLAALTSLESLLIWNCTELTDVSTLAALTSLEELSISNCIGLTDVSTVAALTSLKSLSLWKCAAVREIPDLKHLRFLKRLHIWKPGPLWTLSEEAMRQMVSNGVIVLLWK